MKSFNANQVLRRHRAVGSAFILGHVVVLACALPVRSSEPNRPPGGRESGDVPRVAIYYLGVTLQNTRVFFRGYGWVEAVQITAVDPRSSAQGAGLVAGDIVVWANDWHVTRSEQLQDALVHSNGRSS